MMVGTNQEGEVTHDYLVTKSNQNVGRCFWPNGRKRKKGSSSGNIISGGLKAIPLRAQDGVNVAGASDNSRKRRRKRGVAVQAQWQGSGEKGTWRAAVLRKSN